MKRLSSGGSGWLQFLTLELFLASISLGFCCWNTPGSHTHSSVTPITPTAAVVSSPTAPSRSRSCPPGSTSCPSGQNQICKENDTQFNVLPRFYPLGLPRSMVGVYLPCRSSVLTAASIEKGNMQSLDEAFFQFVPELVNSVY